MLTADRVADPRAFHPAMFSDPLATPNPHLAAPLVAEPLQAWVLLATLAMYVFVTLYYRWIEAALPIRNHLHAELERARATLAVARGRARERAGTGPVPPDAREALAAAERLLRQARHALPHHRRWRAFVDFVSWSRGEEVEALHCIRNAEQVLVRFDPPEAVRTRLAQTCRALTDTVLGSDPMRFGKADGEPDPALSEPPNELAAQAQLEEKLRLVHEREVKAVDDNLTEIMRSSWIMFLCVGMIVACAAVLGHAYLFLAGAIGGLIGRMARVTQVEETSTWVFEDTRAAKLIASPALGAVAGWTGVLLVSVTGIDLLGTGDPWVPTAAQGQVEAFGIALLLGCSEPLLNRVLSSAARRDSAAPTVASPPASQPAPATGAHQGN